MLYTLKDGTQVESIPIGRSTMKIGQVSPDGMLTICDRGPNNPGNTCSRAICRCICGNYTILTMNAFNNGSTKSCGCYSKSIHKEMCAELGKKPNKGKDYTNEYNPFYIFIKNLNKKNDDTSFIWEIECRKCGKRYEEVPSQLISATRNRGNNPCPCWRDNSKGPLKIVDILSKNSITYEREYTFDDCLSPKGKKLKFDFFLPDYDILIEYDGEQHFLPQSFGDTKITGEDKLKQNQEYDDIKNQYCKKNNKKLIRIPYTRYKDMTLQDFLNESEYFI